MSLIRADKASFAYEGRTVLKDISFHVEMGDFLLIVGENGAGKSTLLKGLLGLKKPSMGKISFGDGLRAREIGYLPQQTVVQKDFPASVLEVVLSGRLNHLGGLPFYRKKDKEIAGRYIHKMGICHLRDACYRDLSGGQQQKVLLARALCAAKKMILLDEPITGLDPVASKDLYETIDHLNKRDQMTVIMVSHDVRGAYPFASHVLHIGKEGYFFGTREAYVKSRMGELFLAEGGVSYD